MPINAAVVDLETANPCHASACSVGAARIVDGQVVRTFHQLLRPTPPYDAFYPRNVSVHGIRPEHVADSPAFADLAPRLADTLSRSVVVAHNANADLSMLEQSFTAAGVTMPTLGYVCTVDLARELVPGLPSYRLPVLVQHVLGEPMVGHHDAGQDALFTARALLAMTRAAGVDDLAPFVRYRRPRNRPLPPPKPHRFGVRVPLAR